MDLKRGSRRIVRGVANTEVAHIGIMSTPDITALVNTSPAALEKANEFHSKHSSGNRLLILGAIAYTAGMVSFKRDVPAVMSFAVAMGGVGSFFIGARRTKDGINSLSRSLWIYNETLPR